MKLFLSDWNSFLRASSYFCRPSYLFFELRPSIVELRIYSSTIIVLVACFLHSWPLSLFSQASPVFLFRWALSHLCDISISICHDVSLWFILLTYLVYLVLTYLVLTVWSYSVYFWIVNVVPLLLYCIVRSSILYCSLCQFSYHWLIFFINDY